MQIIQKLISLFMSLIMSYLASIGLAVPQSGSVFDYAYGSDSAQVMDIYVPTGAQNKASNGAVLVLHDGLFSSGSKSDLKATCESIVNRGYIAVALNYRILNAADKTVTVYSVLDDLTDAIQTLKEFAASNKLNLNKIALAGDSAGGYYALMYAYARITKTPVPISFVASRVAPSDMSYNSWKGFYSDEKYVALLNLMAGTSYQVEDLTRNAAAVNRTALYTSPVYYINRSSTPTLFAYAKKDIVVPYSNKTSLETALTNCGVCYHYVDYPSAGHDLGNLWNTLLQTADFSDQLLQYCATYFS